MLFRSYNNRYIFLIGGFDNVLKKYINGYERLDMNNIELGWKVFNLEKVFEFKYPGIVYSYQNQIILFGGKWKAKNENNNNKVKIKRIVMNQFDELQGLADSNIKGKENINNNVKIAFSNEYTFNKINNDCYYLFTYKMDIVKLDLKTYNYEINNIEKYL